MCPWKSNGPTPLPDPWIKNRKIREAWTRLFHLEAHHKTSLFYRSRIVHQHQSFTDWKSGLVNGWLMDSDQALEPLRTRHLSSNLHSIVHFFMRTNEITTAGLVTGKRLAFSILAIKPSTIDSIDCFAACGWRWRRECWTSNCKRLVWITLVFSWVLPLVLGLDAWVFSFISKPSVHQQDSLISFYGWPGCHYLACYFSLPSTPMKETISPGQPLEKRIWCQTLRITLVWHHPSGRAVLSLKPLRTARAPFPAV